MIFIIIITFLFFVVGYMGSTCASTNVGRYCTGITNVLGIRNGLFYGAIYVALGMYMAKHNLDEGKTKRYLLGFVVSMLLLTLEGLFCVLVLKTNSTILWISAVPASYTFVRLCFSIKIRIKPETALGLRKLSTIIYLSHDIFIKLIEDYLQYIQLFAAVTILSVLFGILLIGISKRCCLVKKLFCL
jgi:surface polysaccharide O-acyltransferase-like enzyme